MPTCFSGKGRSLELSLPLFDTCNSNCEFCYEKHHIPLRKDSFNKAYEDFKKYILPRVNKDCYENIDLRLYGGEIFADNQPAWVVYSYADLIYRIREASGVPVKTKFITNGMFTRIDRADWLLKETQSKVGMSYDPVGRFTTKQRFEMFKKNFWHFVDAGILNEIACILSKPCIEAYIDGDEFFDSIPQTVHIDTDFYIPAQNWRKYMSSSEDYYRFFEWGIKNRRFNIDYIEALISCMIPEEQKSVSKICTCGDCLTYVPDKRIFSGECIETREFSEKYYKEFAPYVREENSFAYKTNLMLRKLGCVYCEHFRYCPMQCAASVLFDEYKQDECPMARAFKNINSSDIKAYKDWKEKYRGKNA